MDEVVETLNRTEVVESQEGASMNRSGLVRIIRVCVDIGIQTEPSNVPPDIRKIRKCTEAIKKVCVEVSVKCGISVKKAILAVQIVCKMLYGHDFYLTKEEAIQNDPSLLAYRKTEETDIAVIDPVAAMSQEAEIHLGEYERNDDDGHSLLRKKQRLEPVKPPPLTKEDCAPYKRVLPSPKTVTDYKQFMAIQAEGVSANALYNISDDVNAICTMIQHPGAK